jgi:indole-3-glycerol phosphate synthase
MDAAPDAVLASLALLAREWGMDVLVECHDGPQLDRALELPAALIGINSRDLRTFETRLETTLELASRVPADRVLVTESGISRPADVERLQAAKVSAYLVGSAFMSAPDPGNELARLFPGLA